MVAQLQEKEKLVDAHNLHICQWLKKLLEHALEEVTEKTNDFYGCHGIGEHYNNNIFVQSVYLEFLPFNDPSLHSIGIGFDIHQDGTFEASVGYCCGSSFREFSTQYKIDFSDFFARENDIELIKKLTADGVGLLTDVCRSPQQFSHYWNCPDE